MYVSPGDVISPAIPPGATNFVTFPSGIETVNLIKPRTKMFLYNIFSFRLLCQLIGLPMIVK